MSVMPPALVEKEVVKALGKRSHGGGLAQAKNWCWTYPNYSGDDLARLRLLAASGVVVFIKWGREEAPTTGLPHLQGYLCLPAKQRLGAVKEIVGPKAHLEPMRGSLKQNSAYCSKGVEIEQYGEEPSPDAVSAMNKAKDEKARRIIELAKKGDEATFEAEFPHDYVYHAPAWDRLCARKQRPLDPLPPTTRHSWYHGEPGTGKSFKARSENPNAYIKSTTRWWDGYQGEEVVIIEDFSPFEISLTRDLKIWADIYDFPAEVKGSTLGRIRPKHIIVTSNYSIAEIWSGDSKDREPLERRFTQVRFGRFLPGMRPPVVARLEDAPQVTLSDWAAEELVRGMEEEDRVESRGLAGGVRF